jgi:hypothetical protein
VNTHNCLVSLHVPDLLIVENNVEQEQDQLKHLRNEGGSEQNYIDSEYVFDLPIVENNVEQEHDQL